MNIPEDARRAEITQVGRWVYEVQIITKSTIKLPGNNEFPGLQSCLEQPPQDGDRVNIPEEAIQAGTVAYGVAHPYCDPHPDVVRAILEAAAPLIAAQVLREARQQVMRGVWSPDHEESYDLEDSVVVARALCAVWGHDPTADQCNRPEHDYCVYCGTRTPNQAPDRERSQDAAGSTHDPNYKGHP